MCTFRWVTFGQPGPPKTSNGEPSKAGSQRPGAVPIAELAATQD